MRYYLCRRDKDSTTNRGGDYFIFNDEKEMLEQVHMMITTLGWRLEDITVFEESKQICFQVNTIVSIEQ
jgi:hypothetical protein